MFTVWKLGNIESFESRVRLQSYPTHDVRLSLGLEARSHPWPAYILTSILYSPQDDQPLNCRYIHRGYVVHWHLLSACGFCIKVLPPVQNQIKLHGCAGCIRSSYNCNIFMQISLELTMNTSELKVWQNHCASFSSLRPKAKVNPSKTQACFIYEVAVCSRYTINYNIFIWNLPAVLFCLCSKHDGHLSVALLSCCTHFCQN